VITFYVTVSHFFATVFWQLRYLPATKVQQVKNHAIGELGAT